MPPKTDPNSVDFVRTHYKVPAQLGGRVRYTGVRSGEAREGTITGARDGYLLVKIDGATTSIPYHPKQNLEYIEAPIDELAGFARRGQAAQEAVNQLGAGPEPARELRFQSTFAAQELRTIARPMLEITALELATQLGVLIAKLAEKPAQALKLAREISEAHTDQEAMHYNPAQDVARSLASQARHVQKKRREGAAAGGGR